MSPRRDDHPAAGTTIRRCLCSSWEDFRAALDPYLIPPLGEPLFRGHAEAQWLLSSPWERWLRGINHPVRELNERIQDSACKGLERILAAFKEAAIGQPGFRSEGLTETDWWAIGRHHGLVTPLLDWTRSPYVAAFFAVSEHVEQHIPGFKSGHPGGVPVCDHTIVVWRLDYVEDLCRPGEFEVITSRRDEFKRQKAQQGVFTRLSHLTYHDIESYLVSRRRAPALLRYELSGKAMMHDALRDLERMNITFGSLFPDLHGAAVQANITAGKLMWKIEGPF